MDELLEELKRHIISSLKLADVKPEDIDVDEPLIGGSLGLDSIDTLELLVMLEKQYGVTVPDVNIGRKVFGSVRSLAEYVAQRRAGAS
jgi:acyl carrier protein